MIQSKAKLIVKDANGEKAVKLQKNLEDASIPKPKPESDALPPNPLDQSLNASGLGIEALPQHSEASKQVATKVDKHLLKEDESFDAVSVGDLQDTSSAVVDIGSPPQFSAGDVYLAQTDVVGGSPAVATDAQSSASVPGAASTSMPVENIAGWGFVGLATTQAFAGTTGGGVAAAPVGFSLSGGIWLGKITNAADLVVEAFKADGTKLAGVGKVNADGTYTITVTENYTGPVLIRLKDTSNATNYTDEGTGVAKDITTDLRAVVNVSGHGAITVAITPLTELAVRELLGDSGGDGGTASTAATVLGQTVSAAQVTAANDAVKAAFHLPGDITSTVPVTVDDTAFANSTTSAAQKAYGQALAAISGVEALQSASTGDVLNALSQGLVGGQLSQSTVDQLIAGAAKADTNFNTGAATALTTAIGTGVSGVTISVDSGTQGDFVTNTAAQDITATLSAPLGSNHLWGSVDGGTTWMDVTGFVSGPNSNSNFNLAWNNVTLSGSSTIKLAVSSLTTGFTGLAKDVVGSVSLQAYSVDLTDPAITSATGAVAYAENGTGAVYKTTTTDANLVTYSLIGTDAGLFTIDSSSGSVAFKASPDFETPGSAASSNAYSIAVQATDGAGNSSNRSLTINVTNVNEAPTMTGVGTATFDENATGMVYTATATDPDAGTVFSYALGGTDAALFAIDAASGAVTFKTSPNFEAPAHPNNVYNITVTATDNGVTGVTGVLSATAKSVAITVANVNEAPVITSGASASFAENATGTVYTAAATDQDAGTTLTYSISGTDAALFNIDSSTGAVTFKNAPDFETRLDAGANNVYDITVDATDNGGLSAGSKAVAITVTNVNEAPTVVSAIPIEYAVVGQPFSQSLASYFLDVDAGDHLTYSATGLPSTLTLDASTGLLHGTVTATGSQSVTVTVTDAGGLHTSQTFALNEVTAPVFSSVTSSVASAKQGDTVTFTVQLTEPVTVSGGTPDVVFNVGGQLLTASYVSGTNTSTLTFSGPASAGDSASVSVSAIHLNGATVIGNASTQPLVTSSVGQVVSSFVVDNTAPLFTSAATANYAENGAVAAYASTVTDATTLTYTLSGSVDDGLFNINSTTGAVTFKTSPNFEAPSDVGANNTYNVSVTATDALGHASTQSVAITVTNVNEAPNALTSGATASFAENAAGVVYTASGTDPDAGTTLSYILGGTDRALFNIDGATGAVTFKTPPNFEAPADAGANNVYDITVTSSDGALSSAAQAVAITVTNVNEAPLITSAASASFAENATGTAYAVVATDQDAGAALTYAISGTDASFFNINTSTGVVTFKAAPDFETRLDTGTDNVYDVTVEVSDGTNVTTKAVAITVTNVNEAPTLVSQIPTEYAVVGQPFSQSLAGYFADVDAGDHLTYSATGLPSTLTLDASTGLLHGTVTAIGSQSVTVTATDAGGLHVASNVFTMNEVQAPVFGSITSNIPAAKVGDALTFNVTLTEPVVVSSGGTPDVAFNVGGQTLTATYVSGSGTSTLVFSATAPAAESSAVTVTAINLNGATVIGSISTQQLVTTSVGQIVSNFVIDNTAPVFTSLTTANYGENGTTAAYTSAVTDATTLTYTLSGSVDDGLFTINSATGAVTFKTSPNFEAPADVGANNIYDVSVTATDALGHASTQAVAITVTNANEAPSLTIGTPSPFAENGTGVVFTAQGTDVDANTTLTYALAGSGADNALFHIDSATGAVTFISAPNFEAPAHVNNVYNITVTASDGSLTTAPQAVAITVTNVNEAPVITGGASTTANFAENGTGTAYTVLASDQDVGTALTYAITGTDASLFNISSTGVVTFKGAPDFETRLDAGANNVYDFTVEVSDGTNLTSQAVALTVTNVNEAPVISSAASTSFAENASGTVYTVAATDQDASTTLTYSISGTDVARFNIDATSGALTFKNLPDFEAPLDAGANNVYDITVGASDGTNLTTKAVAITVTNVNEAPVLTSSTTGSFAENATGTVYTVAATDQDAGTTLTYSITGGDSSLFNINTSNGAVTFKTTPNFEQPGDAGANNVYDFTVGASDGTISTTQAVAITVTNVNEAPTLVSQIPTEYAVVGQPFSQSLAGYFTDVDALDHLTYTATGLPSTLTLDASTGLLHGTVTATGSQSVTVTATDTAGLHVASNVFTINEVVAPTLSSHVDGVLNLDVTSGIVLTASENVSAVAGKYIHLVNDGGTGFHGESIINSQDFLVTDSAHVIISGNTITLNPASNLDFNNNYHIEVDAGAFVGAGSGQASVAVTDVTAMNFGTVNPTALGTGTGVAAASLAMNAGVDTTVAGHSWLDAEGSGNPNGAAVAVDFGSANLAIVANDLAPSTDPGIATNDFHVAINNFGVGDLIYFDNHGDNTILRQDNFDAGLIVNYGTAPTVLSTPGSGSATGQGGGEFNIFMAAAGPATIASTFNDTTALKVLLGGVTYEPILYG